MKPDLDEVARDPAVDDVDFFRRIPKYKAQTRVGAVWAPNFYYRTSSVQLLFQAPIERLKAALPEPLEPLSPLPGKGLVALTVFSYTVCDNDPYNEASIAVVVRRPDAHVSNGRELFESVRRRSFYAHVLALPVNTEIARVRGVEGYQLPKWLTEIQFDIGEDVLALVANVDGSTDIGLKVVTSRLKRVPSQSRLGTSTMVHPIDGVWHQTRVQSNVREYGQALFPKNVTLTADHGPLSELLNGLGASKIIQLDVVRDAQLVLNMPTPLGGFGIGQ